MSITLPEIKRAACGQDVDGKSKSLSIVGVHRYNLANMGEDPRVIAEFSSIEPIVSITIGGEITWISLKFISEASANLKLFFRALERYLEEVDSDQKLLEGADETEVAAFISLVPIELAGQYYITAKDPILWALEPESAGEDMRTLRVAFFTDSVAFLESDIDDDFINDALVEGFEKERELNESGEYESDYEDYESDYGKTERDDEFMSADRYVADFDDEEDDDDYDDYDEEDDEEDHPNDRTDYIYH